MSAVFTELEKRKGLRVLSKYVLSEAKKFEDIIKAKGENRLMKLDTIIKDL